MNKTSEHRFGYIFFTLVIMVLVCIVFLEISLRVSGFRPWSKIESKRTLPVFYEKDSVLGWKNKPGSYSFPAFEDSTKKCDITFINNGERTTGNSAATHDTLIMFTGCSITQGWAISDSETMAWKIQTQYPEFDVKNLGTGGYSTYQILLQLEQQLPRYQGKEVIVFYNFADFHEYRTIGTYSWLESLEKNSYEGQVGLPFVTLDKNSYLVRHGIQTYPPLFFREHSSFITLLQKAGLELLDKPKKHNRRLITQKVLLEIDQLCKKYNAHFNVNFIIADSTTKNDYTTFFNRVGINFTDCVIRYSPTLVVKNDGHPNGIANSLFAECIARKIKSVLNLDTEVQKTSHAP